MTDEMAVLSFASAAEWETWLETEHQTSPGLWLRFAKKSSGVPTVTYAEAVEVALCFGWIDGRKGRGDDTWWLQRFTPRRARSRWSRVNTAKADDLIAAGRMRPAGLREVAVAREDGRWDSAYAGQAAAELPADLRTALDGAGVRAVFDALTGAQRYSTLYRVQEAKQAQTRTRRITGFVEMLARGDTPHGPIAPARGKDGR